ncbi:MAG: hypothetical protein IT320_19465 [Anaerolineae bacterium]|nr:hypothetical protein [Anaerolineae bacterium]
MSAVEQEILAAIRLLNLEQQQRVLEFVQELSTPPGEPVSELIQHAREIAFPQKDLEEMARIIEKEFEQSVNA